MGWGYGSGQRKSGAHEKSMGSYELHAWRDAMAVAALLNDEIGAKRGRALYEQLTEEQVRAYEAEVCEQIEDFIKRSESQRPAVLKKLPNDTTRTTFLVLAILGCVRAKEVMELRDNYRMAMAPGSGNRVTTAAMYAFSEEMRSIYDYAWPWEAFDSMGVSDNDDDDQEEGGASKSVDGGKLMAPPAPPPQPAPGSAEDNERTAELLVIAGESPSYVVDAGGHIVPKERAVAGKPLWRVVVTNEVTGKTFFRLMEAKPEGRPFVKPLVDIVNGFKYPSVGFRNVLVMAPGAKGIGEVFESLVKASKPVVYQAKPGVSQRGFAKWLEDYLDEVSRECALIGEPTPTVAEMDACMPQEFGLSYLEFADPKERRMERRRVTEGLVRKVCCGRGRWPQTMVELPSAGHAHMFRSSNEHKGVEHELKRLESKNLSEYGECLASVARLVVQWRRCPQEMAEIEGKVADVIIRFMGGQKLGSMESIRVASGLSDVIPPGSIEADFVDRCMLRRLMRPIEMQWVKDVGHGGSIGGGLGVAWWATVSVGASAGRGALRCIPGHVAASREVAGALGGTGLLSLNVHPEFVKKVSDLGKEGEQGWAGGEYFGRWSSPANEILQGFQRGARSPYAKKDWVKADAAAGEYRVLVTAAFRDANGIEAAAKRWPEAARALQACVVATLEKGGLTERLSVSPKLEQFMAPYIARSPRVAMLVGSFAQVGSHG